MNSKNDVVVGIDLGTTNSEVAVLRGDRVKVLGRGPKMLPSCVGISIDGQLLVGEAARNQQLVYPERTVRSIKRKMGSTETVTLGDRTFTPQEISSQILRELVAWARRDLGQPVERAVITVPAYFSDAQRTATREAGMLAGLEVLRILNEPTAASLAYGFGHGEHRKVMIYDLGGGTFDVSVVTVEDDVTEVLASHGNNQLGGDDFDNLLVEHLIRAFQERHGMDPCQGNATARVRLSWAAEEAKRRLSAEPYARVREEALAVDPKTGKPLHLDLEIAREEYEEMIGPLLTSTLDSVSRALEDARLQPDQLDAILLVGGSTRTPMVSRLLEQRCGLEPCQEIHPDLCVALGAGTLAARLAGHHVDRVLVDVSPFSFGPSHLGFRNGTLYPHCYHPLIRRNTPLPVTRADSYSTVSPYQTRVQLEIFQGDDEDALKNIRIGELAIEGLREIPEANEVLCSMSLDLDGILHVTAIEKETGHSARVTIADALQPRSEEEIAESRRRMENLYALRPIVEVLENEKEEDDEAHDGPATVVTLSGRHAEQAPAEGETSGAFGIAALALVGRSRALLEKMHSEDIEEASDLHDRIEKAVEARDGAALDDAEAALRELLFYVEGR